MGVISPALRGLAGMLECGARTLGCRLGCCDAPLDEALVTADGRTVYRVDDGIPVMLENLAIPTEQLADAVPGGLRRPSPDLDGPGPPAPPHRRVAAPVERVGLHHRGGASADSSCGIC